MNLTAICRDCLTPLPSGPRCRTCSSPRVLSHDELSSLSIAHMDCDSFYAAVEKRDAPALRDKPVIVGGGRRGVVSTCCYIARIRGVRSAMPMFQALEKCPDAVVVKPRMEAYVEVSREIRRKMEVLTPVVEPLSLDEAFMDLTGTERLHGASPAALLVRLAAEIEAEIGVTVSVGLSHNKFLAKIASDLDKPRGFAVIGRAETEAFLATQPVGVIWGVGAVTRAALERDGIRTIADIKARELSQLVARYGQMGDRLWRLAHGQDARRVSARAPVKSISNETTFGADTGDATLLDGILWRMAEKVADRAKATDKAGRVVTLKLKQSDFKVLTRRVSLTDPTQMAETIYAAAAPLLQDTLSKGPFRLLGVGISEISRADENGQLGHLLDPTLRRQEEAERASDAIRKRYGSGAILKGRALK